jgi:hypothetical protein
MINPIDMKALIIELLRKPLIQQIIICKTRMELGNNLSNLIMKSIIPFINLHSGVTLKEINSKGEEKVLNSK